VGGICEKPKKVPPKGKTRAVSGLRQAHGATQGSMESRAKGKTASKCKMQ
jgi:hypothetical protein